MCTCTPPILLKMDYMLPLCHGTMHILENEVYRMHYALCLRTLCVFLCVTYRCLMPLASGWRVWAVAAVGKVLWPDSSVWHSLQLHEQT